MTTTASSGAGTPAVPAGPACWPAVAVPLAPGVYSTLSDWATPAFTGPLLTVAYTGPRSPCRVCPGGVAVSTLDPAGMLSASLTVLTPPNGAQTIFASSLDSCLMIALGAPTSTCALRDFVILNTTRS